MFYSRAYGGQKCIEIRGKRNLETEREKEREREREREREALHDKESRLN
jgi:hypothetical protein